MHKAQHVLKPSYKQVAQWQLEFFLNVIQQILISSTTSSLLKTILLQHSKSNVWNWWLLFQISLVGYYLQSRKCNMTKFITESQLQLCMTDMLIQSHHEWDQNLNLKPQINCWATAISSNIDLQSGDRHPFISTQALCKTS